LKIKKERKIMNGQGAAWRRWGLNCAWHCSTGFPPTCAKPLAHSLHFVFLQRKNTAAKRQKRGGKKRAKGFIASQ